MTMKVVVKKAIGMAVAVMMLLGAGKAVAASDYDAMRLKAERFFGYQEWGSALAMYEVMLDMRPKDIPTYYLAIFAGGMLGNENQQMNFFERTQKQGIALDSIFSGVRRVSFGNGEGDEYEKFLKLVRERQPWLSRGIDVYLLDYYSFRNDAERMIELAERLLVDTPDNMEYVRILAKAYMMASREAEGVECYKHILKAVPDDYDALLCLGVYYHNAIRSESPLSAQDCAALAEAYLAEAYRLRPTPYLASLLASLRSNH